MVSIPIFTSQLKKAREATDLANIRVAKAVAVVEYMNNDSATWTEKYYDVGKGVLVTIKPSLIKRLIISVQYLRERV